MSPAIGTPLPRSEARPLAEGRGSYLDDVAVPGLLHVAFLRSPHAHARFSEVRLAAALALPGVVAAYAAEHLAPVCRGWGSSQTYPGLVDVPQSPLAAGRAAYQGQPVAAVVAESRAIAEDAVELIDIAWQPLPAVVDAAAALRPGAPLANPGTTGNLAYGAEVGDPPAPALFAGAAHVLEAGFTFHRLTGVSMETRGVVASYLPADGTLTIHQSHTAPHQLRSLYAMHLGVPEERIRVVAPQVGGSFGVKIHLYADEIATVAIARLLGRPVKFVADRLESLAADIHARDLRMTARLALDAEGNFLAWEFGALLGMGAFSTHPGSSVQEGDEAVRLAAAPYRCAQQHGRVDVAFQNKTVIGQYRGVGHPMAAAATEYLVEAAAAKLGLPPEELRRRNYHADAAMPLVTRTGVALEALSFHRCLAALEQLVDLPALRRERDALRAEGVYRGIGLCTFVERTATNAASAAHIRKATAQDGITLHLDAGGGLRCAISVTDQGQGTHTVLAQVIADAVGVAPTRVQVTSGDSHATPYGSGVRASRGTPVGGELALQAGRLLRAEILDVAAALLQARPAEVDLRDGRLLLQGVPRMALEELAEILYFKPQLLPAGKQAMLSVSHRIGRDWPALVPTNGIQACHVQVDIATGFVTLLGHWVVDDFGTVVNPLLVEEQVRGGIAQGIGQALFEEVLHAEEGQLLTGSLADYLLPTASDLPDIVVGHVATPWPHTALGAKGAGEAGFSGALGAVMNAVNDAIRPLGARITETPMTPARLLRALYPE